MKQNVTKSDFRDAFQCMDRNGQFSYEALGAIYNWIIEYEESTGGTDTELDVIAICCEWCEWDNLAECLAAYDTIKDLEELEDNTTVIKLANDGLVIMSF